MSALSLWRLLLLLLPLLALGARSGLQQPECAAGEELALTLGYTTNATGHPSVYARLEQPLASRGWQLHVEVGAWACAPRRWLTLTLNGSPPSLLSSPSPALSPAPAPAPAPAPRPAPPGYLTLPGLGHYRAPPAALNWFDARFLCRKEGGGLAVPASRREVEELFARLPLNATGASDKYYVWHGANDYAQEGNFVTDEGVPLAETGYSEFYPGEPNGLRKQNCLAFYLDKSLYDLDCSLKYPFICKVSL